MKPSEFVDLISTLPLDEDILNIPKKGNILSAIENRELAEFIKKDMLSLTFDDLTKIKNSVDQRVKYTKPGFKERGGKKLDQGGKRFDETGHDDIDRIISELSFEDLSKFQYLIPDIFRIKNSLESI